MAANDDVYAVRVQDLSEALRERITVVADAEELNQRVAGQLADALADSQKDGRMLTVICPIGPLDYRMIADEINRRNLSCRHLRTINMDEYLNEDDRMIPTDHPLSFRRFMEETFFSRLPAESRPLPENIVFPDPDAPEKTTELIDSVGGADFCWAGLGITGHVAFNDPPHMTGDPEDIESFRRCKTRKLTICPMATAQMAMGGTNGNVEIIPTRAITIGMSEMLKTKTFHMTFMRSWHAGLWRRAMLGPVTSEFPGSLLQEHPNVEITMTELAARPPMVNTAQATGEERQ